MRQRKKYDDKIVGTICLGIPECHSSERNKEVMEKIERIVLGNRSAPAG